VDYTDYDRGSSSCFPSSNTSNFLMVFFTINDPSSKQWQKCYKSKLPAARTHYASSRKKLKGNWSFKIKSLQRNHGKITKLIESFFEDSESRPKTWSCFPAFQKPRLEKSMDNSCRDCCKVYSVGRISILRKRTGQVKAPAEVIISLHCEQGH